MPEEPPTAPVTLTLYSNAQTPFTQTLDMLVRIANDKDVARAFWSKTPILEVNLPFHDGPGDAYRIIVHVNGYENAGAFVHADPKVHRSLPMLMIPKPAKVNFPAWADLKVSHPATASLIAADVTDAEAEARYTALGTGNPLALACLMNLSSAMQDIGLGAGKTPLDFIRQIIWGDTLAQDRFFAYADPAILPLMEAAATEGEFDRQSAADLHLHPGATRSYKQNQFDYANLQLTFHENDKATIGDVDCIKIEPDMDLYKEQVAHTLAELLPNLIANGKTNPTAILALRWLDAVQSNEPLFDPGYLLA